MTRRLGTRKSIPPDYHGPSRTDQGQRLVPKLTKLTSALERKSLAINTEALGHTAEEILVLTIAGGLADFLTTLEQVSGFEWLGDEIKIMKEDEAGFAPRSPDSDSFKGVLYLFSSDLPALQQLKSAWEQKAAGRPLSGITSKLGAILDRVVEIRSWDWRDRLRESDIENWQEELLIGAERIRFEAELWFRREASHRRQSISRLKNLVEELGGEVVSSYQHEPSCYSGLLIDLPRNVAVDILAAPSSRDLFQESSIYHFWPVGQAMQPSDGDEAVEESAPLSQPEELPQDDSPRVALLDGFPVANHPLLEGRLTIDDPDDWAQLCVVTEREHGTNMASLICLGDLSKQPNPPLKHLVYVRPIMRPHPGQRAEQIPFEERPNDLLEKAIRRIKVGEGDEEPIAPDVYIVNLSVGDLARIYDGTGPTAWARMLDWLQWQYKVLFLVSAGNSTSLPLTKSLSEIEELSSEDLEKYFIEEIQRSSHQLRLLSPAESINGLTIGAHHSDASTIGNLGVANILPFRHPDLPSPSSRQGPGFLRSVKPDLLMPGGKQPLSVFGEQAKYYPGHLAPGLKTAAPPSASQPGPRTKFSRGTSGATALATREAALILEQLEALESPPPPSYLALLTKALLVHGSSWQDVDSHLRSLFGEPGQQHIRWKGEVVSPLVGHGRFDENIFHSAVGHRATIIGWDEVRKDEVVQFNFPIPPSLSGRRGRKRFTFTLAYFSPINPHNRKYRTASLSLNFPDSIADIVGNSPRGEIDQHQRNRGTVVHQIHEAETLRGIVDEEFVIRVECKSDAADFEFPIPFALAVSLEGAEDTFPEIRSEIATRLGVGIAAQPERVPI